MLESLELGFDTLHMDDHQDLQQELSKHFFAQLAMLYGVVDFTHTVNLAWSPCMSRRRSM